ncbi:MAG TPA: DNA repair protein RecN [Candidatus Onthomonas avicola]|nr:DNA repair protein RecN [Candidatus Onthomonas avicola]
MLSLLHIENIAVIQSADILFDAGFNVLTGETGAGKSIVVDAIGAILGARTSRDLIRTGAKSALVSAQFTGVADLPWLGENGFALEDGGLILQRQIFPNGRNLCRLNGRPVTVAQMQELGRQLINIHGQHDGQQLLDPACHLSYLDSFGEAGALLADFQASYAAVSRLSREIQSLQMDEAEKARRMDALDYQIHELERANLQPGEDRELAARRQMLRNAGRLLDGLQEADFALSGGEEGDGAISLLGRAEGALRGISRYSDELAGLSEQLAEVRYTLEDLAEQVARQRDQMEVSPGELDQLEGRLDVIYRLRKKYGDTVEDMLAYLARCRAEREQIEYASDRIEQLERQLQKALAETREKGSALSEARRAAAERMRARIERELSELDMPKVRFQVAFSPKEGRYQMDETGMDEVQFLMSANVGEDLKPIHKIASGGELARIMLALKNVLAENEAVATLVFDEVDTGVSGRAAQKVARKMSDVARHKQVLCVTHLPQIAAMADVHFSVEKGERDGRTYTAVEQLGREARKRELARLAGGEKITDALLQSAGEMLDQAESYKRDQRAS